MLEIRLFMNSPVEDIFAFKCCCIPDQNFEIQLYNIGDKPLAIDSYCDLENEGKRFRINYLFPHGVQKIKPGESTAFYCSMKEDMISSHQRIIFYDETRKEYSASLDKIKWAN
jgi:hypothetical protein